MSARDYYESLLEAARRLHQLELVLEEIHESRGASIGEITDEWSGETPDALDECYTRDEDTFGQALRDLRSYKESWADRWTMYVDSHNHNARLRAISALQNDIDLHHAEVVLEQNTFEAGVNVGHRALDWAADGITGGRGLRVDDAEHVVEMYRKPDKPTPPDYHSGPVFVRYERRDTADPTRGMSAVYVDWPIEQ